jgi:hypothetical protein
MLYSWRISYSRHLTSDKSSFNNPFFQTFPKARMGRSTGCELFWRLLWVNYYFRTYILLQRSTEKPPKLVIHRQSFKLLRIWMELPVYKCLRWDVIWRMWRRLVSTSLSLSTLLGFIPCHRQFEWRANVGITESRLYCEGWRLSHAHCVGFTQIGSVIRKRNQLLLSLKRLLFIKGLRFYHRATLAYND